MQVEHVEHFAKKIPVTIESNGNPNDTKILDSEGRQLPVEEIRWTVTKDKSTLHLRMCPYRIATKLREMAVLTVDLEAVQRALDAMAKDGWPS